MSRTRSLYHTLALACLTSLLIVGCADKADNYEAESTADANPYAGFAGDWMTDVFVGDSEEAAVAVLVKATESSEGWTMKFTHLEEPIDLSVFMKGDTVVSQSGAYPSALREGATVTEVVVYQHRNGDEMNGRFTATYDDGVVTSGRMKSMRVK